ncbi:MAG TPA: alkaline phosphatase family protein [Rhizomicrobium sp.]|nr:alkaline phosphatase family protein [Rhizomicrobium sp.]
MSRPLPISFVALCALSLCAQEAAAQGTDARPLLPAYEHIFVIVAENKGFDQLMGHPDWTPNLHRLAASYANATQFYAETHPSEPNYIAMVGGDTFGIRDDDAYYCKPGLKDEFCPASQRPDYADHTIQAHSLADQLSEHHLTWRGYFEDLPKPGSLVPRWPSAQDPAEGKPNALYAAKHNGFVNFAAVNGMPEAERAKVFVDFAQLDTDLASGKMPNYAQIVPNQCNDMHGMGNGANVPADCNERQSPVGLIERGDRTIGLLVDKIMASPVWRAPGNTAIVVTFDENDGGERGNGVQGCCGTDPASKANYGGGRIPTLVITNHGKSPVNDPTPYSHYSLLRTTEAAFGIEEYLGHAAETDRGVTTMSPLFAVKP